MFYIKNYVYTVLNFICIFIYFRFLIITDNITYIINIVSKIMRV